MFKNTSIHERPHKNLFKNLRDYPPDLENGLLKQKTKNINLQTLDLKGNPQWKRGKEGKRKGKVKGGKEKGRERENLAIYTHNK